MSPRCIKICQPIWNHDALDLLHRGRAGLDTMALNIGPEGATVRQGQPLGDDNKDWGKHESVYTVPDGQTMTRFEFESVSAAGGNRSIGNFLDAIVFREPDSPIKLRSLPTTSVPDHWEVRWWDGKDAHGWVYSRIFVLTALRGDIKKYEITFDLPEDADVVVTDAIVSHEGRQWRFGSKPDHRIPEGESVQMDFRSSSPERRPPVRWSLARLPSSWTEPADCSEND
jgi:hypothetical protein